MKFREREKREKQKRKSLRETEVRENFEKMEERKRGARDISTASINN